MKIVNILFNYKKSKNSNQYIAGVERCFVDYAKHLIIHGNQVHSVTQNNMAYCDEIKKSGSGLLELSAFGKGDVISILRMAFLFYKFNPNIAICHSGRALFFALAARFLSGSKTQIVGIDHGSNPKKFIKADYVLTVNSYCSKELIKAGMLSHRALVVPNMIEVPADFKSATKPSFSNPVKLGSLGRISPEKSFHMVLLAMKILKERGIECRFEIGGVGGAEKDLIDLAKKLELENSFKILGWINDKRKFFNSIDIFVLPSLAETFGIVLLEAMLYSTPIISGNSWGPNDIIEDGFNGLKIPIENQLEVPKLLANAIERMIKNEDEAKKMADNAYNQFFEKYSAQTVGKKLNEIMNMINNKNNL